MGDKGKYGRWNHLVGTRIDEVIDFYDPTSALPTGPDTGDRYIASATGSGWTENNVYEWSGAAWTETAAVYDMQVKVADKSAQYWHNGTSWVVISGPMKRGRADYVAGTPVPRAAEWRGDKDNRHTTRAGREAWANPRPGEPQSSSLVGESSSLVSSSSVVAGVSSLSSLSSSSVAP